MRFAELVDLAGTVMEATGTAIMVVGAALAVVLSARAVSRRVTRDVAFRSLRQDLGRAILLGLEFLVAADIIRTVSTVPSLRQVAVLGGIVVIRTFLSFTLEVELEGRWPWQRGRRRTAATQHDGRVAHAPATSRPDLPAHPH